VNETQGERIAVLEERSETIEKWKGDVDQRIHRHSNLLMEVRLWKETRMKNDEAVHLKMDKLEKRLDAISLRFMLVWGTIGAVITVILKVAIESAIRGQLVLK